MRKIRVAVLGMGHMGMTHLDRLRTIPDVEIAGLCGRNTANGQMYNQRHATEFPVYDNFDQMLEQSRMDALYICLPPYAHQGQLELAAQRGIHLFVEKPLALTLERGASMVEAVEKAGVLSQVGYHMRFGGAVTRLKELASNGTTGRPTLFRASYECNSLHSAWWRDVKRSGGQLVEQVVHLYDMALQFLGEPAVLSGFYDNLCHEQAGGYTGDDTSVAVIRFKNRALGTITGSNCGIPGRWSASFRLVFEHAVADFSDHLHGIITYTKQGNRTEELAFNNDPILDESKYFIQVLRGEKQETASIQEGYLGLKMVLGVRQSSLNGGTPFPF